MVLKFLEAGFWFQNKIAEIAVRIKIIVQTIPITDPGGARAGRLSVLYQSIPFWVIELPDKETKNTKIGITK